MSDHVIASLKRKIEQCEAIMAKTKPIWESPFEALGAFATGRSNRPKSLDRMVDRENNRKSAAFKRYQEAERKLNFYRNRLAGYEAGEVHANGQRRADAPSRTQYDNFAAEFAAYLRTIIKPGDQVAIAMNPTNTLTVKRVNKKTLSADSGTTWKFDEIIPLIDGAPMTPKQQSEGFKKWREENAG